MGLIDKNVSSAVCCYLTSSCFRPHDVLAAVRQTVVGGCLFVTAGPQFSVFSVCTVSSQFAKPKTGCCFTLSCSVEFPAETGPTSCSSGKTVHVLHRTGEQTNQAT